MLRGNILLELLKGWRLPLFSLKRQLNNCQGVYLSKDLTTRKRGFHLIGQVSGLPNIWTDGIRALPNKCRNTHRIVAFEIMSN